MTLVEQQLKDYETEIFGTDGSYTGFGLKELIESHRELRNMVKEFRENYASDMEEAQRIGEERGYKEVINGLYIHRDALKRMTVLELADMLVD